jgi:hypothetical protein
MPDFSSRPRPQRLSLLELLLLGAAGLVLFLALYAAVSAHTELSQAQTALAEARAEADTVGEQTRSLEAQKGGAQLLAGQLLLADQWPPQRVVADVGTLLPPGVRLETLAITYGHRLQLDLHVAARHPADYDALLERLAASPLFETILPGPETRMGEVRASVQVEYRGTGMP